MGGVSLGRFHLFQFRLAILLLLAVAESLGSCGVFAQVTESAFANEYYVVNANIITVDPANPQADAFCVREGRFAWVGRQADVADLIPSDTTVVDLGGLTVVPGFNDAHIHPQSIHPPLSRLGTVACDPESIKSIDELIAALKEKAALTPPGQWVVGDRYQDTKLGRHPTKHDLDQASTEHPIYIGHSSGHVGAVNSLALQMAKIDSQTIDPIGGAFDRQDDNQPNGVLRESARNMVREAGPELPQASTQESIDGYGRQFQAYLEKGITSIQIAGISWKTAQLLQSMPDSARPLRIYVMLVQDDLPELVRLKKQNTLGDESFKLGAIKRWFGNSLSGQTCWLYQPYAGRPDYFGIPPKDSAEKIKQRVRAIHDAGLQACIHANGDREIDMLLDAFEAVLQENPRDDHRHRIEHCSVVNEEILQRIKTLGVVLAPHSYVYEHGDKMEAYGEHRWNRMHPNGSAIRLGIPVAGNSDAPVSAADPMLRIQSMVTRQSAEGKVYGESQKVSVEQAIGIWTMGSAHASFDETIKGSITAGKLADFVVLDQDPRQVEPSQLRQVVVEKTFVGGKLVYRRMPAAK